MILCFDIGGTAIKGALASRPDQIQTLPRQKTPVQDFSAFVQCLNDTLADCPEPVRAISLSLAAVADPESGKITCANIPCINGRPLARELEEKLKLPVILANDADCFAVAEAGLGAGRGHSVVFGVILGTGVGGGLVVDGRLVNANGGFAGEWGHGQSLATIAGDPPVSIPHVACGCGRKGCVDTYGAARGLERLHKHLSGVEVDSEGLIRHWLDGHPSARRTMDIYVELLAAPLSLAINITGASIVPVGGGLSNVPELLMALDEKVRQQILRQFSRPIVVKAECALEPGLIGAALNGLQFMQRRMP